MMTASNERPHDSSPGGKADAPPRSWCRLPSSSDYALPKPQRVRGWLINAALLLTRAATIPWDFGGAGGQRPGPLGRRLWHEEEVDSGDRLTNVTVRGS